MTIFFRKKKLLAAMQRVNYTQLIFVFLAFLVMVLLSYFFAAAIVEKYMSSNAEEVLTAADIEVSARLREAEISVLNIGLSIRNRLQNRQSVEEIHAYLREAVQMLKDPERDQFESSRFVSIYGIINGRFIDGSGWSPQGDYRPQERPWYKAALENRGRVSDTQPYPDARDGSSVVAASMVLEDRDTFYGVICCDLYFEDIAAFVESLRLSRDGFGMLLGPDFQILAHPDKTYPGRKMQDLSPDHARVVRDLRGASTVSLVRMENYQNEQVVAFFRRMGNGWIIGITTPQRTYYRDVYRMAAVLAILGIVLSTVLCGFLVRLNRARFRSDEENRSKTSFLARMSHEIRTPMNSIIGMSDILLQKGVPPELFEYVSIIRESGNTLLAIINDVLDFSKIESGRIEIENREYFTASLVNDVINVIRVRAAAKNLDFFVAVDSAIPEKLLGDDTRIRQVLINLLNNAVKYTREGYVALRVEAEGGSPVRLRFVVSDSGMGIKSEDITNLFTEFTRMDADRGIEGSGLGLAIANRLCEAMGGLIDVESEYGRGSVFTAILSQGAADPGVPMARIDNPRAKRVLLYDERPRCGDSAEEALRGLGLEPRRAADFAGFLAALEGGGFDFAFVSSGHGIESIRAPRPARTRLVVMAELGDIARYGETTSVLKPVYSAVLANVINGGDGRTGGGRKEALRRFTAPDVRVLIVDDLPTNLKVASELLAPYRMTIDTCLSGAEAVELVLRHRYDIVFMDHMMPGMDGLQAAAQIRSIDKNSGYFRDLPVIMLTANVITGQRELFFENGISDFLAKPIEIQKLHDILEKWIPPYRQVPVSVSPAPAPPPSAPPVPAGAAPGMPADAPAAGPPPESASPESVPPEDFSIPGVDTARGVEQSGGSFAVFMEILSVFAGDAAARLPQIRDAAAREDFAAYTSLVHAIKGAALSVGARETGNAAARLEAAGRNRDAGTVAAETGPFLAGLAALAENINKALKALAGRRGGASGSGRNGLAAVPFHDLKKALLDMDTETVSRIMAACAGLPLDGDARRLIGEIREHILLFEYDRAVEKIDTTLALFGSTAS